MKAVDYVRVVPILVKAIKEQQAEIEELKTLVEDQERRIQTLEANLTVPVAAKDNPPPTEELPATGTE